MTKPFWRSITRCSVVWAILLSFVGAAHGSEDIGKFTTLEARAHSRIGVVAVDASRNRRVEYNARERFAMCSTFKVLAAAAVLKRVDEKRDTLDRFVRYGEAQLLEYAPVTREHVKEGGMTLEALCAAALLQSDNTAGNLLLEAIGGPKGLTEFVRTLGDNVTRLDRMEPELNLVAPGDERDTTTPAAMCQDLERLFTSDVLTADSRTRLEDWMRANQTGLKMIRASVPADWRVGDKTGRSGKGATNDIAIVRPPSGGPIFIAIYVVDQNESQERRDDLVAEVARATIETLKK
jgi:beta-lactamase class A